MPLLNEVWREWRWRLAQWLERHWWSTYTKKKNPQDYLAWKRSYWNNYLTHLPPHLQYNLKNKNLTILDMGCGPAGIFMVLERHTVDCVDPLLPYYIHLDIFDPCWYPNASFYAASAEQWTPHKQYDIIFCTNALDHMKDWEIAVNRMASWLKARGFLVVSVDIPSRVMGTLLQIANLDPLHPHKITHTRLIESAPNNSLRLLACKTLREYPHATYTLYVMQKVSANVGLA